MSAWHIERGGIIVVKDEFPDTCPIIVSGKADVLLNIDDQHPLSVLRAGNMVAELGIVEGKPCSEYVINCI
jgi:CRP-like cAMP-binding protein